MLFLYSIPSQFTLSTFQTEKGLVVLKKLLWQECSFDDLITLRKAPSVRWKESMISFLNTPYTHKHALQLNKWTNTRQWSIEQLNMHGEKPYSFRYHMIIKIQTFYATPLPWCKFDDLTTLHNIVRRDVNLILGFSLIFNFECVVTIIFLTRGDCKFLLLLELTSDTAVLV